jgi:gliding motility-associated-like protein
MILKRIRSLWIILHVITGYLNAQVYSPAANDSFAASYNPPGGTDMVFVFNLPAYNTGINASITAVSVDRLSGWSFQWSVYNPSAGIYQAVPGSITGWFSEIDTITVSSGYQVVMTKGASTNVYRVWVVINDLDVFITNKDEHDKLLFSYYNCSSLDLRADTTRVPLFYYNPGTRERIIVNVTYTIRWSVDNPEASVPPNKLITRVTNPPYEDTWYTIKLSDPYGMERYDSVFFESIRSKAVLAAPEYIDLSDATVYPENYGNYYNDDTYSAPGKFRFDVSGSKNMASYSIDFGDGEEFASDADSLNLVHEYEKPGIYKVVLTTKSDKPDECIDSISAEVKLNYAKFMLPNVFTPNEDGDNDLLSLEKSNDAFRSEDVSVLTIEIAIYDRAGLKVHDYSGNIRDWKGWDGMIRNSNRKAPEGIYFYVISVLHAYEDNINPINRDIMKGFIHLYRD